MILDISYLNRSTKNQVLAVILIVAYQNGVQLNHNFNFSDPADQTLNNNLSSGDLNKPMDGILSYQMRDQKQVLVIKP